MIANLPSAGNFYDLFAGGCAVTHAALLSGKYENYYANDIDNAPELFIDSINGKYQNEKRWISREEFFALKDKDAYIRYCWSFGNRGEEYMYSKEVEPWKKALHYARFFNDFSLFAEYGINLNNADNKTIIKQEKELKRQYIKWFCENRLHTNIDIEETIKNLEQKIEHNSEKLRQYLIDGLKKANKTAAEVDRFLNTQMARHYFAKSQWTFPTREVYIKLQGFLYLPLDYDKIDSVTVLFERLNRLKRLSKLQRLHNLEDQQIMHRLQSLERLQIDLYNRMMSKTPLPGGQLLFDFAA